MNEFALFPFLLFIFLLLFLISLVWWPGNGNPGQRVIACQRMKVKWESWLNLHGREGNIRYKIRKGKRKAMTSVILGFSAALSSFSFHRSLSASLLSFYIDFRLFGECRDWVEEILRRVWLLWLSVSTWSVQIRSWRILNLFKYESSRQFCRLDFFMSYPDKIDYFEEKSAPFGKELLFRSDFISLSS